MNNVFSAMLRGFGWTVGRRAAYRVPLPLAIAAIVAWHYLGGQWN